MKQLSLVTIICGTVIVLAPLVHNLALLAMLTHLLALNPHQDFHLEGGLGSSYQDWCLFIGVCLFVVGIISGFSTRRAGNGSANESSSLPAESHP